MQAVQSYSELILARRHVVEAEQRVARQAAIAADLAARAHPLAPLAERVLEVLRDALSAALNHADGLERRLQADFRPDTPR